MIQVAMSLEFALFQYYDRIAKKYWEFINSGVARSRMEHLGEMRNICIGMKYRIKKVFGERPIPNRVIRSITEAVKPTLSSHYLNFTQLYQCFIHSPTPDVKMHYLTALWYHLEDMGEVILHENCEPEKLLEQKGD